jgi:thiol-disulfide isomerase/thioredoxin
MNVNRLNSRAAVFALAIFPILLAGCDSRKQQASSASSNRAAAASIDKTKVPEGDADLLQTLPLGKAGPMSEADKAWEALLKSMEPPSIPQEWQTNPPSQKAIAEFQTRQGTLASEGEAKLQAFAARYPTNEHAAEAAEMEHRLLTVAAQLGSTNAMQRLQALDEARLKDPNLTEDERLQLKVEQIQRRVLGQKDTNSVAIVTELEKGVRELQKEFPKRGEIGGLLLGVAEGWMDAGKPDKARELAQEVADGTNEPEIQEPAQTLLKKLGRIGKPLALKFKAIDGREVDVQAMKGKVVLVDFWATWCAPCMAELPKVKDAYARLNPKGFEIVGVSFDRERSALEKVIAAEKMPWPQHFDESAEGNKFGEEFQIASIPTMWLLDKKGNLRELNARENLIEKVEKLLAE